MPEETTYNQKIGEFIKNLREQKGLTQEQFSTNLGTSQSAVARMEAGEQNFTTQTLQKISEVLNRKIVSLNNNSIDFRVRGGRQLSGKIATNVSKNGAMGILCASLLNKGTSILHGIPRIEEVNRIIEVLESIAVKVDWLEKNTLRIRPPKKFNLDGLNYTSASKTRTIIMFIGALIHMEKQFSIPNSQGCKLGKRTISAHLFALEKLGVKIKVEENSYQVKVSKLRPAEIVMYEVGETATENILIAAAKIKGKTIIKFASHNYMVRDVCYFLEKMGVKIEGIGTSTLTVYGKENIDLEVEYFNSEDPIEAMMLISTSICTNSEIMIERAPIDFLEMELLRLEKMGFKYKLSKPYFSYNGHTKLVDIHTQKFGKLKAPSDKITCAPYPHINMDNLPFFVPVVALASGTTLIHDWAYENRAIYFMELTRLGAQMILADPHRVYIDGVSEFKPAQVVCPPALRPAMIILIGMLGARGESILRNVYSIKRGYEEVAERLNSLGADIEILSGEI